MSLGPVKKLFATVTLFALCACGSSGGSGDGSVPPPDPPDVPDPPPADDDLATQLFFGTKSGPIAANGLAFATAGSDIEDVVDAGPIQIKVLQMRAVRDTGVIRLIVSDEELDIRNDPTFAPREGLEVAGFDISIGTDQLAFLGLGGPPPSPENDDNWLGILNTSLGAASGTGLLSVGKERDDPDLPNDFISEAVFVYGFETDPAQMATVTGQVTYTDEFLVNGFLRDLDGELVLIGGRIKPIRQAFGTVTLTADFDTPQSIAGTVIGSHGVGQGDTSATFVVRNTFDMSFETDIEGNGYSADLQCNSGCVENNSIIAGTFFGENALETSGIIGIDYEASVPNPADPNETFDVLYTGTAGFTATQ